MKSGPESEPESESGISGSVINLSSIIYTDSNNLGLAYGDGSVNSGSPFWYIPSTPIDTTSITSLSQFTFMIKYRPGTTVMTPSRIMNRFLISKLQN